MKPLFFGSSQKPLFGLHTPPSGEAGGRGAVLLCAPVGQEYMRSHRTLRELAGRLSQSGFHVLRFDYYGCGDSGGTALEGDLDQWTSDVGAAIDEARDGSGFDRVSVVGLRLGAALAARASVRRSDLERLVFWEPVVDGRGHLEEQIGLHRTRERAWGAPTAGRPQVLGFPLSDALRRSLESLDATTACPERPGAERTLVVTGATSDEASGLAERLAGLGANVATFRVESAPFWHKEQGVGQAVVPHATLQRIVAWFTDAA